MITEFEPVIKDPQAALPYGFNWSTWLGSDTIATSTWTVPTGLTKGADSHTTTQTLVWLSGGTDGEHYRVTNHIVTAAGKEDDRSLVIAVKQR